ncbi:TetR/AcrR family transcriptional regulator [Streptomyces sp. NPDC093228]|jgi:AcrR family transcriptional regulator|uniref:TetR/AcrR family transcriptional regulator n=1 Tax=unclassified Streptomyces TaxID=2593676 RepID=UPI00074130F5|nr:MULTISPECIES: TetR/AcrR family transcriptional regulator [unclassified Streptomyces]KUJ54195.1 TetR family transcriptional regulator [Streptomyces sp. NRRL F-5122]MDX3261890.1 TetR/AcrR family transcriptional regulator [Streptomyces sp. MI02-2A]REE59193.1 TetR family transcriptional regulator [Streptomyces sp. 3212.3]
MDTKQAIIEAAAELLARSPSGDVSTRGVCDAAGVQQPVLYRLFGDKEGLLAATVDHVWDQYLGAKRVAEKSADPLEDLRAGWDSHTAFALAHPNAYKLMFAPTLRSAPEAAREAMRILREVLERLAAQGRLRVPADDAARMVMSANTGVALSLITRPALYPDAGPSTLVRDAIHHAILVEGGADTSARDARAAAASTLLASLDGLTPAPFTPAESGLLEEWLERIPAAGRSD